MPRRHSVIEAFNRDVTENQGYRYSTRASLSSRLANLRLTEAALAALDFKDMRVLDIGCGDGSYTIDLFDRGKPASMLGIDLAKEAIKCAKQNAGARNIVFMEHDISRLPFADGSFDIAHIRGVLHHLDEPLAALREAMRVARTIVVLEPNGYNPALKAIELLSAYHREHKERSYLPLTLNRWVKREGGEVFKHFYVGLVPFFFPAPLATILKMIEPFIERLPLARNMFCGVYVFTGRR